LDISPGDHGLPFQYPPLVLIGIESLNELSSFSKANIDLDLSFFLISTRSSSSNSSISKSWIGSAESMLKTVFLDGLVVF
jgi:hypothetical protein